MASISIAKFIDLDLYTLHDILRLRTDVFVVEQRCPYPELDGRDTEAGTWHVWAGETGRPESYLRVTDEAGGYRIGRVCTAQPARGQGLAGRLVAVTLERLGDVPVWMHAQVRLAPFYERYGFVVDGQEFDEDDIAHVLMTRCAPSSAGRCT